nr:protein stabilized1 [Tanacetum cinerariifolium]
VVATTDACENGHIACPSCCTKMKRKSRSGRDIWPCPFCDMEIGSKIGSKRNRCRGLEKLSNQSVGFHAKILTGEALGNDDDDNPLGSLQVVLTDPGTLDCSNCQEPLTTPIYQKRETLEPEENTFFHTFGGKQAFIEVGESQELLKPLQEPGNNIRLKATQLQKAHCTWESLDVVLHKAVSYSPQDEVLWLMVAKEKWLAGDVLARHILQELYPAISYSEEMWLVVKLEFENNEPVKGDGRECVFEVMVDARSARG